MRVVNYVLSYTDGVLMVLPVATTSAVELANPLPSTVLWVANVPDVASISYDDHDDGSAQESDEHHVTSGGAVTSGNLRYYDPLPRMDERGLMFDGMLDVSPAIQQLYSIRQGVVTEYAVSGMAV